MRVAGVLIALVLLASSCGGDAEPETAPSDGTTAGSADDPFGIAGLSDGSTARAYCETEDFADAMEEVLATAIDGPPQSSGIEPLRGPTYDCRFGAQYEDVYVSVSIGLQGGVAPSELHSQTIEAMGRTQITAVRDERTDDRYLIVQDANGGGLSDGAALGLRYKSSTLAVLVEAVSNADRFEEAEAVALAIERLLPRLAAEATGDFSNQAQPSASSAPSPADDDAAAPTTDGAMDLQIVVSDESSIDAAVGHVETELAAAGFSIDQWEVSTDGNRIAVVVQGVSEAQVTEFSIGASAGDSELEARPVVAVAPDAATAEALGGEQVEDASGLILVLRDGVSLAGEVTATASFTSAWVIDLTFTGSGLDAFNQIANQCFVRGPQCLSGQLALVYGERVLTAPAIQAPSFESNQLLISGSFSEAEANELAAAINGGGFFEIVEIGKRFEPA